MSPKVTINLLGWNSKQYLKQAFDSVFNQTYPEIEVLYIDNASKDGSVNFVRKHYPQVDILVNRQNLGYAQGHNLGILRARGSYVVCMNPDIIMTRDFIAQMVNLLELKKRIGAACGKLYKMHTQGVKTKIFDSAGFKIFRSRRVVDRGHGELDQGQYDLTERVFGVSGALPFFRKKALEDVKIKDEYFDRDFENYKEDVDLCWRLNLYGWHCVYHPKALAYHERGTGLGEKASNKNFVQEKSKHSYRAKYFSFKNQGLLLAKNDFLGYILLDLSFIFLYEAKRWGYVLLHEPRLLRSFFKLIRQLPRAFKKRLVIMRGRRIKAGEIRKFFPRRGEQ